MSKRLKPNIKTDAMRALPGPRDLSFLLNFSLEIHKNLDLDRVLQFFAEKAAHFLNADACLIHLSDDEGNELAVRRRYNLSLGFTKPINPKEGMGKLLFRDKKALIFPNILKNPNFLWQKEAHKEGLGAAICQPLQGNEKTIGILTAFSRKARRYSKKDLFRLDALAAVSQSPIGPTGVLQGTVTDANTGLPVSGAAAQAVGPITRTVTTDAGGAYSFPALSEGTYNVTVTKFGYHNQTATGVAIVSGATITLRWNAPETGAAVTGYRLVVGTPGDRGRESANGMRDRRPAYLFGVPVAGRQISGTVPRDYYNFFISAENACGLGVPAGPLSVDLR